MKPALQGEATAASTTIFLQLALSFFTSERSFNNRKGRLAGLCRRDGLREYGQPWYVSSFSSRLFHSNSVSNKSEMLPGGVAGSCDLARRVNAPHARIRSFCTVQGSNDESFSQKSMRVSLLTD